MPRFLAVYTMTPDDLARFRELPKAEQDAVDARGVPLWKEWEQRNAAHIVDSGHMVGKTLRVRRDATAPATNDLCGYLVVEAPTIEDAARLFDDHPHIRVFPGDSIDIMPFVS